MEARTQFKSVKARLIFWFLLVALTPLIIVTIVNYELSVQHIKDEAFNKLSAIRDLKVNEVNLWLNERLGDILTMSDDPHTRRLESRIMKDANSANNIQIIQNARQHLARYLKKYPDYHEMFIINPISGIIVASTDITKEGLDKSKDPYFTEPLQTNEVFIKDIYFSETLNRPSMSFSNPIHCLSHDGEHITGILVARVDLKDSLYALLLNRTGMGESGETLIVNKDAAVLASRGKAGITEIGDYRGDKVLAAYTHIPRVKWGFVAKQDLKEVYAPVRSLLWNTLILLMISSAIVYGIAVLVARKIAQPILEITDVSRIIRSGDLSARSRIKSIDEVGYLAETFNEMAESLSSQISAIKKIEVELREERDSLEGQVHERTLTLQQELKERKQAEEEKKELETKLQRAEKMEAMGLMAGGVAHDLNNILSGIVSYPELLLMDIPEDSPMWKPIKTIQESGMRAADVVEDLLTIARGVATGKEVLNLNTLITEYLGSAEHQKIEKIHPLSTFKTEFDPELLNITGSASHIKKILMNLVTNASEAIEGSGTVTISTTN